MDNKNLSQRELIQKKYNNSRSNLMIMIVFTVINVLFVILEVDYMLLFSATVPILLASLSFDFIPYIMLTLAVIPIVSYILFWVFSKKHYGWLIAACVLFSLDTLALIGVSILLGDFSGIIDFAFHIWVLYYLIVGIKSGIELRKLPPEEPKENTETPLEETIKTENSSPLRMADMDSKSRILLEADAIGHHIVYRRIKRTNELVIDGNVYSEVEMLIEPPHTLSATIDGHEIIAGYNGTYSYLTIDGEQVAKKLRLY